MPSDKDIFIECVMTRMYKAGYTKKQIKDKVIELIGKTEKEVYKEYCFWMGKNESN